MTRNSDMPLPAGIPSVEWEIYTLESTGEVGVYAVADTLPEAMHYATHCPTFLVVEVRRTFTACRRWRNWQGEGEE